MCSTSVVLLHLSRSDVLEYAHSRSAAHNIVANVAYNDRTN
jgi:hypothetical protein